MTCVVIRKFPLPTGYNTRASDLLLRLPPGYPDLAPDMWWFDPAIRRVDNIPIAATEVTEYYLQRQWQRWSRHLQSGQWKSGIDSLESYIALIKKELINSAPAVAA
jgi:hypothetical protein